MDQAGQIALQVRSERKEVRKNDHLLNSLIDQSFDRASQIGLTKFQKGRFHIRQGSTSRQFGGDVAHGLIGRFDPRTVTEDNEARDQAPLPWI